MNTQQTHTATQLELAGMPPLEYPQPSSSRGVLIRELPANERPCERLVRYGAGALSTTEILALLLGLPALEQAANLLVQFEDLQGLAHASPHELAAVHGMGPAKAARLKAALELGRRATVPTEGRPQIRCPADAAQLLMAEMSGLEQEEFRVVLLDTKNRVLGIPTIYVGSLHTVVVRTGEVFREAIRANAASIIAVHNHPSTDCSPSPEDLDVTRSLVEAGKLLSIELLDHLILGGQGRFVSLKERNLGFD